MTHWFQLNVSGQLCIHALPNTEGTRRLRTAVCLLYQLYLKKKKSNNIQRNYTSLAHQRQAADLHLKLIVSEGLSEAPSYRDQRQRECVSLWLIQMSHSSGGDALARGIKLHSNELLTGLKHLKVMSVFFMLKHFYQFNVQRQHWLNNDGSLGWDYMFDWPMALYTLVILRVHVC